MTLQIVTTLLMTWILKPLLLLGLLLMAMFLLRKKSASLQHFVLALGLFALLLQPLLGLALPTISWHLVFLNDVLLSEWAVYVISLLPAQITKAQVLIIMGCYFLVASWLIFYFLLGVWGLYQQTRSAQSINSQSLEQLTKNLCELLDIARPVKVVTSLAVDSPQMWGLWHPVIMLPRDALLWNDEKQLTVMIHELGHIKRYDWLTTIGVKLSCAFFWFLPLVWWFARKLYQQAEIACDDFIYRLRDKHLLYAEVLMAFAGAEKASILHDSSALGIKGYSAIYERIYAVLDKRRPRHQVPMEAVQYWFLCSLFVWVPLASLQLMPIQQVLEQRLNEFELGVWKQSGEAIDVTEAESNSVSAAKLDWRKLSLQHPDSRPVELAWESQRKPNDKIEIAFEEAEFNSQLHTTRPLRPKLELSDINIEAYLPLSIVTPNYPSGALQRGIEGWVQVEFTIDIDGFTSAARIIAQSPARVFEKTVLTALAKSRYRPQIINGQAIGLAGVIEQYTFKIEIPSRPERRR